MKERVLQAIESAGGFVSGEEISAAIGKSRTAVWKWISELRADGYVIDAVPRKGYRLAGRPDRLYPCEIARHLETDFVGRTVHYLDSVTSTNDEAKALAKEGAAEGLVVVAEEQVKGRGRRGRSWASPPYVGVWSSTVLRPIISPQDAPKVALVAALAAVCAVEEAADLEALVKWPNDVLVNGKKVAGILVEMEAELDAVRFLVIGIGINANLPIEAIPEEARERASTLVRERGQKIDRALLLGRLLTHLERFYLTWQVRGFSPILREVRERTAYLGRDVKVVEHGDSWVGEAVSIAPDGSLLVRAPDGKVRSVYAAEVSLREVGAPQ